MSREKQIEEMTKVIKSSLDGLGRGNFNFTGDEISKMFAEHLYNAGNRKQSENAVEVVRCKDCQHWETIATLYGEDNVCRRQGCMNVAKAPDDFCSWGERKE